MSYDSSYTGQEFDDAIASAAGKLPKSGGASEAMTGPLYLRDQSDHSTIADEEAVCREYVDSCTSGGSAGIVFLFAGPVANKPMGSLVCDGAVYKKADYPTLSDALGGKWDNTTGAPGTAPEADEFRVPFLTHMFPKGASDDNDIGIFTASQNKDHTHTMGHTHNMSDHTHTANHNHTASSTDAGSHAHNVKYSFDSITGSSSSGNGEPWGWQNDSPKGTTESAGTHNHTITVNTKNFSTGGPNTNSTGNSSTSNTGNNGGINAQPKNVGVYYCVWTGEM